MGSSLESHHSRSLGHSGSFGSNGLCRVTRSVTVIVVHCTATRVNVDFTQQDLLRSHRAQGMTCVGYHFYIRKDGYI